MIKELALAAAVLVALSLSTVAAQVQPPPPATFFGSVKVDGQNVADGTPVIALVDDKVCGEASREAGQTGTWTASTDDPPYGIRAGDSMYVMEVFADSQVSGCGREGATVTFKIGDRTAQQIGLWMAGPNHLSLTSGTAAEETATVTPTDDETPIVPTVEQEESDSGFNWWWPAIGGGAVLAAGVALGAFWRGRKTGNS